MTKLKTAGKRRAAPLKERARDADPAAVIGHTISIKIMRIAEAIHRSAERVFGETYDLRSTDRRILVNLSEPTPITLGELSRRVRIDKAWISRSLPALCERKLVAIATDPEKPRHKLLSLTPQGKRLLAQIAPIAVKRADKLLQGVDQAQAEAILDRIWANVRKLEDEETGGSLTTGEPFD